MARIAVIAAMEREVRPLIRSWKVRNMEHGGWGYRVFENGEAALVCGGIGAEAARRAAEAMIREVNPVRLISAGFAGALDDSLQVGDVLRPCTVVNAADGARTDVGSGKGVLVSSSTVADKEQKIWLGKAYGASAVDMEAAAVARGAEARGVEFGAFKAISDASGFSMPEIDGFVANDGTRFPGTRALGPDRQLLALPEATSVTGRFEVYDEDGVTLLGASAAQTLSRGQSFRLR